MTAIFLNPPRNCPLCPRLAAFRHENRAEHPDWWNSPVPAFGALDAKLLVVGLAPGLRGANATGRPFTGDYAGIILYGALKKAGLATGNYSPPALKENLPYPSLTGVGRLENSDTVFSETQAKASHGRSVSRGRTEKLGFETENTPHPALPPRRGREVLGLSSRESGRATGYDDGFTLINTRVTNAVRCVPPQNKPIPEEIRTCNRFLQSEIAAMPSLRVILSLGAISHKAVLRALGKKQSAAKFGHGAEHDLGNGLVLLNSYHTSRYNMNTGVLTEKMFEQVIKRAKALISAAH